MKFSDEEEEEIDEEDDDEQHMSAAALMGQVHGKGNIKCFFYEALHEFHANL